MSKEKQKFEVLPVHPETREEIDEIGSHLAKKEKKRKVSYDKILKYLVKVEKQHGEL